MGLDASTAITLASGHTVWDEGTEEHFGRGGDSGATWTIRTLWAERQAVAAFLLGGSRNVGNVAVVAYGQAYSDNPAWLAQRVTVRGEGLKSVGPNGMIAYEWAVLSVSYSVPKHEPGNAQLVGTEELDFASHAIALDQGNAVFEWASGPNSGEDLPPSALPAVSFTTISFNKVRYRLAALPLVLIESLIDHVNDRTLFGATAGQLLFRGPRSFREITAGGEQNWDVSYRMEFSRNKWNRLPDGANGWQDFAYKSDGSLLFPEGNLNQLFE